MVFDSSPDRKKQAASRASDSFARRALFCQAGPTQRIGRPLSTEALTTSPAEMPASSFALHSCIRAAACAGLGGATVATGAGAAADVAGASAAGEHATSRH